jgi:hypothetical protein
MTKQRKNLGGAFRSAKGCMSKHELQYRMLAKSYNTRSLRNLVIYDGKFCERLQIQGADASHPLYEQFIDMAISTPLPWRICFMTLEGDERDTWAHSIYWNADGSELHKTNDIGDLVNDKLVELIDSCNQKQIISYAWFAIVSDVDIEQVEDEMLKNAQRFSGLGATVCASMIGSYDLIAEMYKVMRATEIASEDLT